jgi:hypothetical protein
MSEKQELTIVQEINNELAKQTKDPATMKALMAVTFKGFKSELLVRQACLEAMMNGYTFQDLVQKKVYAIPFGDGYSLVQSIEDVRTTAMNNGQCGKSAPEYEEDANGNIKSCSVTVKRKTGETIGDYTATVYFKEYDKGRDNWKTKPRTMIAKVAEMHALRMAFPSELSKAYIEDEFREETTAKSRYADVQDSNQTLSMNSILKKNEKTNENQTGEDQIIDAESNEVIPPWSEKA